MADDLDHTVIPYRCPVCRYAGKAARRFAPTPTTWTGLSALRCCVSDARSAASASGQWYGPPGDETTESPRVGK